MILQIYSKLNPLVPRPLVVADNLGKAYWYDGGLNVARAALLYSTVPDGDNKQYEEMV